MSDYNGQSNQRQKTALNDYRYPHPKTREPVNGGKYPAQMFWEIANNGKIVFKLQDGVFGSGDNNAYKKKQQEIEGPERNAIFALLEEAANNPDFRKSQYAIKRRQFVRDGGGSRMSANPIVLATFTVVRDANGQISLGFTKSDVKALFVFDKPSDSELTSFIDGEYRPDHALMSKIYVKGYIKWVSDFLDGKEHSSYQPPKPRDGGNGGGGNNNGNRGGGNNWNGNSGGGGNSGGNDFDDDMPDF